jgi:PemK-like, MazF-like toxin of type II toxin-antitoxin system
MRPGEIYDIYFQYQNPAQGGKFRPVLILGFRRGKAIAVALKITKSGPTNRFPHRVEIRHWRHAGLPKPSWVQYDWYAEIPTNVFYRKFYGTMHPNDFANVVRHFRNYHGI